jgi:hypothetical protein
MQSATRTIRHWATAVVALLLLAAPARALPAVFVGQDGARRVSHTAHVVLMLHDDVSVVTIMADYAGPMTPFAVILPVPSDVTLQRVQSVKREFIDRVEEVSAPRFHTFYEMDPCQPGLARQQWEEKFTAGPGPGFLAAPFVPPADAQWKVPKEVSIPVEPVFKGEESEFRYELLAESEIEQVATWLERRGYRLSPAARNALNRYLLAKLGLLVAEVNLANVELVGADSVQLGGIRYWSRQPVTTMPCTLGLLNSAQVQDLFLYVLHRDRRFEVKNYGNVLLPTNLRVDAGAEERVAQLYNALFDFETARHPGAFVSEFAWSTAGCGQPCSNAPLQVRELLSLGGDVLEAETVPQAEQLPEPPEETEEERQKFENEIEPLKPAERLKARQQRKKVRRELARRRALIARQHYTLTRLHYRYQPQALPRDIELAPAARHVTGGVGVPQGQAGRLSTKTEPARQSTYQVRFIALEPWTRDIPCPVPLHWRWGTRWSFLGHLLRKVFIAQDLPRHKRNPALLTEALQTPLPQYGLRVPEPKRAPLPSDTAADRSGSACDCCVSPRPARSVPALACLLACASLRCRRRARAQTRCAHGGCHCRKPATSSRSFPASSQHTECELSR